MPARRILGLSLAACLAGLALAPAATVARPPAGGTPTPPVAASEPGPLFHLSADHGLTADFSAAGSPEPNFASEVTAVPDGARGPGLQCGHTQLLSYWAPGNIYAARGTLSLLLAVARAGGSYAVPDLPCGLRRSLELGHGVAAHR